MSDIYTEMRLFVEGGSTHAYRALGAHIEGDVWRVRVYAPNAAMVAVTGDFCGWNDGVPMWRTDLGMWECELPSNAKQGDCYKFAVTAPDGHMTLKSDPFGFKAELRPSNASVLWESKGFDWTDEEYMAKRRNGYGELPRSHMSIYEVHLGSWQKGLSFVDASIQLVRYARDMGYTHIEIMPLSEYPLDDSWGYQAAGYYSVTARYGTPEEFKLFVDRAHAEEIGVILDWVPAHFVKDDFGLRLFDGTPLYESAEPLRAEMPLWGTLLFDYSKPHVRSFLMSNAVFLAEEFHIDGLRFDAVSCMLYHDFCKDRWIPEPDGSNVNRAAAYFIREVNNALHSLNMGVMTIAEESSAFPFVTAPTCDGGLGFDFKWNMGFMNDTLSYFELDSLYRGLNHKLVTFPMTYAFSERYILPFSHDEMVCGKRSIIGRMCGNYDAQHLQTRLLYAYQYAVPGKKLLFMGTEIAQYAEWAFAKSLDWFLLDYPAHAAMQSFVRALNGVYRSSRALARDDVGWDGFKWLSVDDSFASVIVFVRTDPDTGDRLLCAFNFTPVEHPRYGVSVDAPVTAELALSTHAREAQPLRSFAMDGGNRLEIPLYGFEGAYYRIKNS